MEVYMKKRLILPTVFASIGALLNILVSYMIAYFATGGTFFSGTMAFDFDDMWLVVTIMAMVAPVLSLVAALILNRAPKTSGVLQIISALEYGIVFLLTPDMKAVPYLLLGSIGAVILFVTGIYCLVAPYVNEPVRIEYTKERSHHKEEAQADLANSKNH
jgi:hypothetical protein